MHHFFLQSVVELRNKPEMWHKAKKVILSAGQTDVKFDFPLPIVACNLMIEYSDFYDNFTATTETLQCPRCRLGESGLCRHDASV